MGPAIAHTFVSFGFGGRDYVAMSAETRTERGEGYSSIKGFFKQYELMYVVGDERDLIGLRTTYRKDPPEDVYLYRVRGPIENLRRFFMDYIRQINELAERPAFYNTLTTNCTTNLLLHTRVNPGHLPYSWKVLLSGYLPEYAYEQGRLDTRLPFEELRKRSKINAIAAGRGRRTGLLATDPGGPAGPQGGERRGRAYRLRGCIEWERARSLHGIGS